MTEDKFEGFLGKAAQSYNAPPARTPREEMWQAIQATRAARPRVVYGGASLLRAASENQFGSRVWWAAAAAVVLVASGIGIGRWSASPDSTSQTTAATPRPAPALTVSPPESMPDDVGEGEPALVAGGRPRVAPSRTGIEGSPTPEGRVRSSGSVAAAGSAPISAYQLTAANHLSDAEALLTSFRTRSAADQHLDAQLTAWARELLSNTRLLLDSPVAVDPQRRPLLRDLELLLVQIVQLSPGSTPQDREIIERTLKQDHVLTRLRTAIPAGQRGS
ncbi:MAG: hypothetical protein WD802_10085 [Gemmatimonadaceae bacterium]